MRLHREWRATRPVDSQDCPMGAIRLIYTARQMPLNTVGKRR